MKINNLFKKLKHLQKVVFILFVSMVVLNFGGNLSIFAQNDNIKNNLIICIDNFDCLDEDMQHKFYDLQCNLNFKVSNINNFSSYPKSFDKMFISSIIVPKSIMSIVANGDSKQLSKNLYDSMNIAKQNRVCVLIFDMKELDAESAYYLIFDNVLFMENENITLCNFDFIYNIT